MLEAPQGHEPRHRSAKLQLRAFLIRAELELCAPVHGEESKEPRNPRNSRPNHCWQNHLERRLGHIILLSIILSFLGVPWVLCGYPSPRPAAGMGRPRCSQGNVGQGDGATAVSFIPLTFIPLTSTKLPLAFPGGAEEHLGQ